MRLSRVQRKYMADEIQVEVAYALPEQQILLQVRVEAGATVEEAIKRSGILRRFPEINLTQTKVGIFSKLTQMNVVLRDRDRVEIYRPLLADPKEVRRQRAEAAKGVSGRR